MIEKLKNIARSIVFEKPEAIYVFPAMPTWTAGFDGDEFFIADNGIIEFRTDDPEWFVESFPHVAIGDLYAELLDTAAEENVSIDDLVANAIAEAEV